MSIYYINVETIKKCQNVFFLNLKKFTRESPANEFLSHKCRNIRKIENFNIFFFKLVSLAQVHEQLRKCTSPANKFLLHMYSNKMY